MATFTACNLLTSLRKYIDLKSERCDCVFSELHPRQQSGTVRGRDAHRPPLQYPSAFCRWTLVWPCPLNTHALSAQQPSMDNNGFPLHQTHDLLFNILGHFLKILFSATCAGPGRAGGSLSCESKTSLSQPPPAASPGTRWGVPRPDLGHVLGLPRGLPLVGHRGFQPCLLVV